MASLYSINTKTGWHKRCGPIWSIRMRSQIHAKKKQTVDFFQVNSSAPGALHKVNFTTSNVNLFNQIQSSLALSPDNLTSSTETLGTGALKYVGSTYFNGSVFVGTNTNGGNLVSFVGVDGLELLVKAFGSQKSAALFNQLTVTQVDFSLKLPVPPSVNSEAAYFKAAGDILASESFKSKSPVSTNKNSLVIGKASSNTRITLSPVMNEPGKVTGLIARVTLSKTAAADFLGMLPNAATPFVCFAASFNTGIAFLQNCELVDSLRLFLAQNYNLSSLVRMPSLSKTPKVSKELRPVLTGLTMVFNRLSDSNYSEATQKLMLENFFKRMVKEQGSIENYSAFIESVKEVLQIP
uniref:hypothetical protein n=1 Tax=Gormaniella terricola TaxID=2904618 RepID=UPI0021CCCACF|nr:hypothetical protein ODF01_pgp063 [Gormaniella terricola]UWV18240.1 hypothetical protein [Gormaniella terricola]